MSWTPKPGDRVTSPLLVGEWEVRASTERGARAEELRNGSATARETVVQFDMDPRLPVSEETVNTSTASVDSSPGVAEGSGDDSR